MVFNMMRYRIFHTHSCGFINFQNTRKFCLNFVGCTTPTIFLNFTGHSKSHMFSNFLRAFLMVSLNSVSLGDEIDSSQFSCVAKRWSFSSDHFCFSFSFACCPINFQSTGHWWSGLDVSCFLVNRTELVRRAEKPVQGSVKSRDPSIFQ